MDDLFGRLIDRRQRAGVSIEQLARVMRLHEAELQAYESRERSPGAEVLLAMLAALKQFEPGASLTLSATGMQEASAGFEHFSDDASRFAESVRLMSDFAAIDSPSDRNQVLQLAAKLAPRSHE